MFLHERNILLGNCRPLRSIIGIVSRKRPLWVVGQFQEAATPAALVFNNKRQLTTAGLTDAQAEAVLIVCEAVAKAFADDVKNQLDVVKNQVDDVKNQVDVVKNQVGDVKNQVDDVKNQVDDVKNQVRDVKKQLDGVDRQLDGVQKKLNWGFCILLGFLAVLGLVLKVIPEAVVVDLGERLWAKVFGST